MPERRSEALRQADGTGGDAWGSEVATRRGPALEEVTSGEDPRLALYRDLKDSALRRSAELAGGYFIVEGRFALEAALGSGYPVESVLVLRRRVKALEGLGLQPSTSVYVVDDPVMAGIAGFPVHRGLLGLGRRLPLASPERLLSASELVVVVEGMSDQENLGAVFRNAAGFGAGAVLLDPTCADPLYRRSIRVSVGQSLRVPFARLEPWPEGLELLGKCGFVPVALAPDPSGEPVGDVAAELQRRRVALLVGSEGPGLSQGVLERCRRARVPMAPGVDSLNVAVALGIALHRFARLG